MSKDLLDQKIPLFSFALDDLEITLEWIKKMSSVNTISCLMSCESIEKDEDLSWRRFRLKDVCERAKPVAEQSHDSLAVGLIRPIENKP